MVQVSRDGTGRRRSVQAPGRIIDIRTHGDDGRFQCLYIEVPKRRRIDLQPLAKSLGKGALGNLRRNGILRGGEFSRKLNAYWNKP